MRQGRILKKFSVFFVPRGEDEPFADREQMVDNRKFGLVANGRELSTATHIHQRNSSMIRYLYRSVGEERRSLSLRNIWYSKKKG